MRFQSSPAPKGRCNCIRQHIVNSVMRFNPHRPRRADATNTAYIWRSARAFQSSPAPKGRCNWRRACGSPRGGMFQSSPAPKGRCNGVLKFLREERSVSILTGPEGPMQRRWLRKVTGRPVFQSSPAPKGRCNVINHEMGHHLWFQSSPAPKGRCNGGEIAVGVL